MTTQPGFDAGQPTGEGSYRPEAQPWDPAYLYPYGYPYGPYAYGPPPVPPVAPKRRLGRRAIFAAGIGAVAAATVVTVALASSTVSVNGTAIAAANGSTGSGSGSSGGSSSGGSSSGGSSGGTNTVPGGNTFPVPNSGTGGSTNGGGTSSGAKASAAQQIGVVDIDTTLKYQQAAAAGTGMVLTSNGEILTNNHVIDGATSIKVTVVSTGKTYVATVVGTAPTKDIAVLQLQNASGLATANIGDSSGVAVGDSVTGVGNAGGVGGTPSAAAGKITALGRTITASDETGSSSETLHGVIVTDAPIMSGDSGGPLYNASGKIIGIDTAASTSGTSEGFAIPINDALSVAAQIEKGIETSAIHIGYPGFLGISLDPQTTSPLVTSVLTGGPAAKAGIDAGDVITKVGGTSITTSTQVQKAVSSHTPGSKVSVSYTDPSTGSHTVTVTLATGPAD